MARRKRDDASNPLGSRDDRLAEAFLEYAASIEAGEGLDEDRIRCEHPELAGELIEDLRTFVSLGTPEGKVPSTLGDYTLRRQIGRGGMSVVYEAWQGSVDRPVALKVLPAGVAADAKALARFIREARIAAKLNHAGIVPVYGMGVEADTPFFAMELIQGETLAQLVRRRRAEEGGGGTVLWRKAPFGTGEQDLVYFGNLEKAFTGVADALHHAHSRGVVHRDVKPSNLIFDAAAGGEGGLPGRLRILDFGLARLDGEEGLTASGEFLGTPLYMSPEQARRQRVAVDHCTDIYSLGATMYETLCGGPPFQGRDHQDTLSQIIERYPVEPRKLNPRVPRDLETIVLKCLRKDATDRYGTAEAMGQDLRRFVRGDPVEARPEAGWERLRRQLRRRRIPLLIALVFLALLSALGWLAHRARVAELERSRAEYVSVVLEAASALFTNEALARDGGALLERPIGVLPPEEWERLVGAEARRSIRETAALLAEAARAVPERPEGHYHLARALAVLGDREEAAAAIERALESDPDFVPALRLAREIGAAEGPEGDQRLAAAARRGWRRWWLEAEEAAAGRRWHGARGAYDELIALRRRGAEPYAGATLAAYMGRGLARLGLGDPEGALQDFAAAGALAPGALEPELFLARAWRRAGEGERARGVLEALWVEARDSERQRLAFLVTASLLADADREEALAWTDRLADGGLAERVRAWIALLEGRWQAALRHAVGAVKADGGDVTAWRILARALLRIAEDRRPLGRLACLAGAGVAATEAEGIDPGGAAARSLAGAVERSWKRAMGTLRRRWHMERKTKGTWVAAVVLGLGIGAGGAGGAGGGECIFDDFADGDPFDGEPIAWLTGDDVFCGGSGAKAPSRRRREAGC